MRLSGLGVKQWAVLLMVGWGWSAAWGAGATVADQLTVTQTRQLEQELRLIVDLLQNYHYAGRRFSEVDAAEVIDRYVDTLDPDRLILTVKEREFLRRRFGRTLKTVFLPKGDARPAYEMFDFFRERALRRWVWVGEEMARGLDLESGETLEPEPLTVAEGAAELDDRWRLLLKNELIDRIVAGRTREAAIEAVRKRFERQRNQLLAMDALVVREMFLERLLAMFDPHSGYFSAEHAREFAVEMAGQVGGLGLVVWMDEGRCRIAQVEPGSPAEAISRLAPGMRLLALAEAEGDWIELAGMRIGEVTTRLRGQPGTKVRLRVGVDERSMGPNEGVFEVTMERVRVQLIEGRAHAMYYTLPVGEAADDSRMGMGCRIGWIGLPSFYAPVEGTGASGVATDVRELLAKLIDQGIEGLVLDLRDNPGGGMDEAVELAGLFLGKGPVLITQSGSGTEEILQAKEEEPLWGGPLVVLTSRGSASASELLAGALQVQQRAVVVGDDGTFGKGTAQTYLDLNAPPWRGETGTVPWGMLRMTTQRFFFLNGTSPQEHGVRSDIVLPRITESPDEREASMPHALAAEILPGSHDVTPWNGAWALTESQRAELHDRVIVRQQQLDEYEWLRERSVEDQQPTTQTLSLEARQAARAVRRLRSEELRVRERTLIEASGYRGLAVETEAVSAAMVRHQKQIEGWAEGEPMRWLRGRFYVRAEESGWQDVDLMEVDFARYTGAASKLAQAYAAASDLPMDATQMAAALTAWRLLNWPTDGEVLACFGGTRELDDGDSKPEAEETLRRRGIEAVLQQIVSLDPALLDPELRLDVGRREALRVAADWAMSHHRERNIFHHEQN